MPAFRCEVFIRPRTDILDPQGDAIGNALASLGFGEASGVRMGRCLTLTVDAASEQQARARLDEMCGKLLANPVTEDYDVKISTL